MLMDEKKTLNLINVNDEKTFVHIKSFLDFHDRAGSGEVAIKCGDNREIRNQVARGAYEVGGKCYYDYIYNEGCIIVELND